MLNRSVCSLLMLASLAGCSRKSDLPQGNQPSASSAPTSATATVPWRSPSVPQKVPAPADVAAPPATAARTDSGIASVVLNPSSQQDKPRPQDCVTVAYSGWTRDGVLFDSTSFLGEPKTLEVTHPEVKGWSEALGLMSVGEKRRFWIPSTLAYGDNPARIETPPGQLTFDVELLSLDRAPDPPPAPSDVAAAPADAPRTQTGLAYKVIREGKGKARPALNDNVEVNFTGWTSDGKQFDSSIPSRRARSYTVARLVPGWAEGLMLMVEGERRLLWIPSELAHGDSPKLGKPKGNIVVDVELVRIKPAQAAGG